MTPIYDVIDPYSEMKENERYFLNGIIRALKPRKILEVGVSSGGGSAIILNAISDIDGAKLYSVDYAEKAYRHPDKLSGFLVNEKFPELADKWQIFRGGDVSRFIEQIGGDIDFLMLDTAHIHPWETLNFLCILPFMSKNYSWTVLHDIAIFMGPVERSELACRYLFGHVVSEEKITPSPLANIGAFKISDVTYKYVQNLFEALFIPFDIQVSEKDLNDIRRIIEKYYTQEQYKFFCEILEAQEYMFTHQRSLMRKIKDNIKKSTRPELLTSLRKIKNFLRIP